MNKSVQKIIKSFGIVDAQEIKTEKIKSDDKVVGHKVTLEATEPGTSGTLARRILVRVDVMDAMAKIVNFAMFVVGKDISSVCFGSLSDNKVTIKTEVSNG